MVFYRGTCDWCHCTCSFMKDEDGVCDRCAAKGRTKGSRDRVGWFGLLRLWLRWTRLPIVKSLRSWGVGL